MPHSAEPSKVTVLTLSQKYQQHSPITVVTAYDYPSAQVADEAGVDAILVGDSLAMVVLGHPDTLAVTMEEMLHHARAVRRGTERALVIADMPFMSYQASIEDAVRNAGRFLQAGADAVKLEGGRSYAETVTAIVRAGIPVQGHIGLLPQSVHALGGFRVQGKTAASARALLADAIALEEAGCFSIVLESVPERVATYITERIRIPTIGIGAGSGTSGQVLVWHDLLGWYPGRVPRFVKQYAALREQALGALQAFRADVEAYRFPDASHVYAMPEKEWEDFLADVGERRPQPTRNRR